MEKQEAKRMALYMCGWWRENSRIIFWCFWSRSGFWQRERDVRATNLFRDKRKLLRKSHSRKCEELIALGFSFESGPFCICRSLFSSPCRIWTACTTYYVCHLVSLGCVTMMFSSQPSPSPSPSSPSSPRDYVFKGFLFSPQPCFAK